MHLPVTFDSFKRGLQSCEPLGNSREPPVAIFFGPKGALKQKSRASPNTRQSGSPPGAGRLHAASPYQILEDENEDEVLGAGGAKLQIEAANSH
jgi:hypothetical protein